MEEVNTWLARVSQQAIRRQVFESPRSKQVELGISDLGTCRQRNLYQLRQTPRDGRGAALPAFCGIAIGDHTEQALAHLPDLHVVTQKRVTATITDPMDSREYSYPGTIDLWIPDTPHGPAVIDVKTVNGFDLVKRLGPTLQQNMQLHLGALGLRQADLLENLSHAWVANLWIDRSGQEEEPYVLARPYDPSIIDHAVAWARDIHGAHRERRDTVRDKQEWWCERFCDFYTTCRPRDHEPDDAALDEDVSAAVNAYLEGTEMSATGGRLKAQARNALRGVEGATGTHRVRWNSRSYPTITPLTELEETR